MVTEGQKVHWNTVTASTFLPGSVELINIASKLGLTPQELPQVMLKLEGDSIEKGEVLACSKGFWGLFKSKVLSPIKGTVESISEVSGLVVLRAPSIPVEISAYVEGEVEKILPDEGVVIKTEAAFVQGIFGIGGETAGELHMFCQAPYEEMDPNKLDDSYKDTILVGGSLVTAEFLHKAVKTGVKAVVVGGISDSDLTKFLGYDLGVAITGSEQVGLTLIITEGFGKITMAERSFNLLKKHEGEWASVSGATQIRAGVIRPEIIVAHHSQEQAELAKPESNQSQPSGAKPLTDRPENIPNSKAKGSSLAPSSALTGLNIGTTVRLIREPHFGELATVVELPSEVQEIPTGAKVRVAVVKLNDNQLLALPRANLEIIEQ